MLATFAVATLAFASRTFATGSLLGHPFLPNPARPSRQCGTSLLEETLLEAERHFSAFKSMNVFKTASSAVSSEPKIIKVRFPNISCSWL